MPKYSLLLAVLIFSFSFLKSQPYGELVGDRVVAFYPENFNASQTLPSFALIEEPDSIGPVPDDWQIAPEFYSEPGLSNARIHFPDGTDLYGTGEVVGPLRRNGTEVIMWNTDNYGYWTANGKRLYQSHPWIMGVRSDGASFGILVDHTWKQTFFLDDPIEIKSEGPPFRILVIERESPQEMMKALAMLTGAIDLPPLWALGYHQCRYSYYPDDRVMEIAAEFRERNLPCDVIWMDIDYMDGYRVFTFDPLGFPDPEGLNAYLHQRGFKSIWMIDPGVKKDPGYFVYDSGTENDVWVQQSNGETYIGDVWPGPCTFPDYTMPEARIWWSGLYQDFMATGIDGVWNDMNEPAVFDGPGGTMPDDNIHRGGGGLPQDVHLRYHNVYGYLMVQASREGILQANPEKRPFVLTRANYLGGHRFAATWTGDNVSSTEHMKLSVPMALTLGLSGQPFSGPDIGGFVGSPSPELMGQWMALGAFYPFSRNHTSVGTGDQEPWSFGEEIEEVSRTALNRRYRLLPYFYTLFREASLNGMPLMQPVFFADPADLSLREEDEAFMLGSDLLIVPRWADNPALPAGNWRQISIAGEAEDDLYQPEMLQRGGSVIPLAQPMQSTAYFQPDSITLIVLPDEDQFAEGSLYADAGEGWDYLEGQYALTEFTAVPVAADSLLVSCSHLEGQWEISGRKYRVGVVSNYGIHYSSWTSDTLIRVWMPPEVSVTLTSPEDGQQFPEGADVFLSAVVESEAVVEKVEFYREKLLIGEDADAPYEFTWIDPENGLHDITAAAVIFDTVLVHSEVASIVVGDFGSGSILSQIWYDIPGVWVENLTMNPRYPADPDENNYLDSFSTPVETADHYGRRVLGYVHPPVSGYYRFWISGDDYCELWLSTDSTFNNRQLIAEVPGWTLPGEWEKYPEQQSLTVSLAKGEKYCIMALQKEEAGGDFVEVAWDIPGNQREVISGVYLSPYDEDAAALPSPTAAAGLQIYPNPAEDVLYLKTGGTPGTAVISDLFGRKRLSMKIENPGTTCRIPVADLPPGLYFLKWQHGNLKEVLKFIVR
ncbi:MAG: TIM-barrel domain-containing protein [Bacteroidales bacterium]